MEKLQEYTVLECSNEGLTVFHVFMIFIFLNFFWIGSVPNVNVLILTYDAFFCCQTATEIKVKSDAQNEPILLVVTATRQENLSEVENKVSKTVKVVSIFCFEKFQMEQSLAQS